MVITYIGHSGFMAELEHSILLFDCLADENPPAAGSEYSIGQLPPLNPEKEILVFVSHQHQDHYSHKIWKLREKYPRVTYILSKDVPLSSGVRRRLGITEEDLAHILRVKSEWRYEISAGDNPAVRRETTLTQPDAGTAAGDVPASVNTASGPDLLVVETLRSTDEGVAFWVTTEGKNLFHAGDLNLWLWEEEGEDWNRQMQADFARAVEPLRGRTADVAFLPLDGRQEIYTYSGMDAYLSLMHVRNVFPMHLWKQYELIGQYRKDRKDRDYVSSVREIQKEGETFII